MKYNLEKDNLSVLTGSYEEIFFALHDGDELPDTRTIETILSYILSSENCLFAIGEDSLQYLETIPNGGQARITHFSYQKILSSIPNNFYAVFYKIRARWDVLNYYFYFAEKDGLNSLIRKNIINNFIAANNL